MRLYTAYIDPASLEPDRGLRLVKDGMCWPAFFFTLLWALWHRLWWKALWLLVLLVAVELITIGFGADPVSAAALSLGVALYAGLSGNDWRGRALERRGLELVGVVAAADREEAAFRLTREGALAGGYRPADQSHGAAW